MITLSYILSGIKWVLNRVSQLHLIIIVLFLLLLHSIEAFGSSTGYPRYTEQDNKQFAIIPCPRLKQELPWVLDKVKEESKILNMLFSSVPKNKSEAEVRWKLAYEGMKYLGYKQPWVLYVQLCWYDPQQSI